MAETLAIVTQDPANYGGVLRLVEYIYARALAAGLDPTVLHYASNKSHPELNASLANLLRGELNLRPSVKHYTFGSMNALAIGATLPEWEPNRIAGNTQWKRALSGFTKRILVTGSAHTGLPLANSAAPFFAWVSSTVENDRRERLRNDRSLSAWLESRGLPAVEKAEAEVLNSARRLLVVSEETARSVAARGRPDPETWPFPIDTNVFRPTKLVSEPPRFLFVGRANDPRKRIGLFYEACRALSQQMPRLQFTAAVVSNNVSLDMQGGVTVEHYTNLDRDTLIRLYSSSTALVVTSEQEGLGIAAMEAMACGLPVISTRCGGPETFLVDGGTGYFTDANANDIAQRMASIASERSLRDRLSQASRSRIELLFSESVWNARFESLLLSIAQ